MEEVDYFIGEYPNPGVKIPKIKCKYCDEIMSELTYSFVSCFNDNCPYRNLPMEEKEKGMPREYSKQWKK